MSEEPDVLIVGDSLEQQLCRRATVLPERDHAA